MAVETIKLAHLSALFSAKSAYMIGYSWVGIRQNWAICSTLTYLNCSCSGLVRTASTEQHYELTCYIAMWVTFFAGEFKP